MLLVLYKRINLNTYTCCVVPTLQKSIPKGHLLALILVAVIAVSMQVIAFVQVISVVHIIVNNKS